MTIPNQLTLLRILLIPVFIVVFYLPYENSNFFVINKLLSPNVFLLSSSLFLKSKAPTDDKHEDRNTITICKIFLENKFWNKFVPRYSMVSFYEIPYGQVYERGKIQFNLMDSYISGNLTKTQLHKNIENQLKPIR